MGGCGDQFLKPTDELLEFFQAEFKNAKEGALNTFLGSADNIAAQRAKDIIPEPGFHDIVIHADDISGKFFLRTPKGDIEVSLKTLVNRIKQLNLDEGVGIRLISCNGGACGPTGTGPAYALQKAINRPVLAHHAPIEIWEGGELFPFDSVYCNGKQVKVDAGDWTRIPEN